MFRILMAGENKENIIYNGKFLGWNIFLKKYCKIRKFVRFENPTEKKLNSIMMSKIQGMPALNTYISILHL